MPENYEVENYEGNPAVKLGGNHRNNYLPPRRKKVKWSRINMYGWVECQTCGFVAATNNGRKLHEAFAHSPDPTNRDRVHILHDEVTELLEVYEALPERTNRFRIVGPSWWRNR